MNDDAIDRETNVTGELTERGIKGGTNLRTLAALDLWFGRKLQGWAIKADRYARIESAKTDVQVNLIKAAGAIAVEKLGSDPELVRDVLSEQLGQIRDNSRKMQNKKAVMIEAVEVLEELSTESMEKGDLPEQDGPDQIDEDLFSYLGSYAEKATSEGMRKMWGRVIAGELRRPGSFSLTTLRIISELNQEEANAFQQVAARRFDGEYVIRDDALMPVAKRLDLESVGLLHGATGGNSWALVQNR